MDSNFVFDLSYYDKVNNQLMEIINTEKEKMLQASIQIAQSIANQGLVHIFGTGHSHLFSEEAFYRAGGLACINPILEPSLMLHAGAMKSSTLEDLEGYAEKIFNHVQPEKSDIFVIFSNSGVNYVPVEMAKKVKDSQLPLIGIGSKKYSEFLKKTKNRQSLSDFADIFIDNHAEIGDAVLSITGIEPKIAPTSTVCGAFILNLILANVSVWLVQEKKLTPPIFISGNLPDGKKKNTDLYNYYRKRVRAL
ncbi:MAG: SIS domain-containing protein [Candidatus Atribacteria bacterium]|nr:SIS domain-containing protein [Candidatus Atribacteria bacterium]